MSTNQMDLSHGQSNANGSNGDNNNSNLEELVDREKINGTPFYIERTSEKEGYYIRMGRHRLTAEWIETKEEALEYINYNMYDLLMKMVLAIMRDRDEIEKLEKEMERENLNN